MKKNTGELAKLYCEKYKTLSSTDVARLLYHETDAFTSVEGARSRVRYYRCKHGNKNRKRISIESYVEYNKKGCEKVAPKILIFDIETAPSLAHVWGMFKVFVQPSQLVQSGKILSYAAKWLGNDEMFFDSIRNDIPNSSTVDSIKKKSQKTFKHSSFEKMWDLLVFYSANDERLCRSLHALFEEADIVVAHNGQAFDVHTMNAYWLSHGITPPSPYKIVDTLKIAKREFRFPRNKLESIARFLDVGKKTEHEGFELWVKCMAKDEDAWDKMEEYNKQDVILLEEVYMLLRPWDTRHPNVSLCYGDDITRCTVCGSSAIKELTSTAKTAASEFPSFRCESCGHIMRSRSRYKPSLTPAEQMANVI